MSILYFIACAAGPARHVDAGVRVAQDAGWDVCLILTPSAARWWEPRLSELAELTGHPVRDQYKLPHQTDALPRADAMLVAPLTTTSACKWAAGITDTVALGLPAEGVHLGLPVVAMPFWSTALGAQPAVGHAVETLRGQGVRVVFAPGEPHPPKRGNDGGFPWRAGLDTLARG
ncbi:flavoprotein [Streptomyces sp. MP131-18]|uniref:flavoprotein n=1 Tax=Streptomyces sp. MP131-18 TaxID=1857892 RepID=UPI00097BC6A3|nr:flavoprotein [Streptomyces sp. MP131-18]ONK14889.1 bifunctional phosphopantothenoylcysteine decarboxylase/phosphopantothenate synthase [Streptomyces sp. MP131-18]